MAKKVTKNSTKKLNKKATKREKVSPRKTPDIPATKKHIDEFRFELKSDIASVNLKIGSLESKMDSKFNAVDSRLKTIESKIEEVLGAIHKNTALVESQEDRNKFVLDGYSQIYKRQDDLENKVDRELSEIKRMIKEQ